MKKFIFLFIVAVIAFFWFHARAGKRYPPGILIPDAPRQTEIADPESWNFTAKGKTYKITPRAEYALEARVLSTNNYSDAMIGPIDVTIGWGPMSDQSVLDRLKIWQDNMRFWYCKPKNGDWPIPMEEIALHAVNTHLIPSTPEIEKELFSLRKGDLIKMKGELVDVERSDGFSWNTSTDPSGFGDHSCKIIWVKELALK